MSLPLKDLKILAKLMVEELQPERTEIVLTSGEEFDGEAMDLARAYMRATGRQRKALLSVVESFGN